MTGYQAFFKPVQRRRDLSSTKISMAYTKDKQSPDIKTTETNQIQSNNDQPKPSAKANSCRSQAPSINLLYPLLPTQRQKKTPNTTSKPPIPLQGCQTQSQPGIKPQYCIVHTVPTSQGEIMSRDKFPSACHSHLHAWLVRHSKR
jgi:hypothetical protein